jgi:hypothetical protein
MEGEEDSDVLAEHKRFTERKTAIVDALFRKTRSVSVKRELMSFSFITIDKSCH